MGENPPSTTGFQDFLKPPLPRSSWLRSEGAKVDENDEDQQDHPETTSFNNSRRNKRSIGTLEEALKALIQIQIQIRIQIQIQIQIQSLKLFRANADGSTPIQGGTDNKLYSTRLGKRANIRYSTTFGKRTNKLYRTRVGKREAKPSSTMAGKRAS